MSASSEREGMPQRQLGELMTELGLISEEQLATVLEVQQQSKRPLGQIIVELGFASGAAVAHALAMQSGGALRTEYGYALGAPPVEDHPTEETTPGGLPKLRLASTAVAPSAHRQTLAELREEHERATAELERLQASAAEQEPLLADIERLETALAEAQTTYEQNLNRLQEEHDQATAEIERLQSVLVETGS